MKRKQMMEEHLERLWSIREQGDSTIAGLEGRLGSEFDPEIVADLERDGLITREAEGTLSLTASGLEYARKLIRAHRIGERLIHDVLGRAFEEGACELEHVVHTELVDSICTLLGHPRECPHGMPIPEGECCRRAAKAVHAAVIPLTELRIGERAKVAYVWSRSDQQLHIMDSLQIKPGVEVLLHQRYPSWVIECEGASIAIDRETAEQIRVWEAGRSGRESAVPPGPALREGRGSGTGAGEGRRGRERRGGAGGGWFGLGRGAGRGPARGEPPRE